jgi:hypothetical protein
MRAQFIFSILFLFSLSTPSFANAEAGNALWEKMRFEQDLSTSLNSMIEPLIPKTKYILQVMVDFNSDELVPRVVKDEELPKNKSEDTDILLSKLGIWSLGPKPVAKGSKQARSTAGTADLMNLIAGIKVDLQVDNTVDDAKIAATKKLIQEKLDSFGVKNSLSSSKMDIYTPPVKEELREQAQKPWTGQDWIAQMKMPAVILLGTLLLLMGLFTTSAKRLEVEREKIRAMLQGKSGEQDVLVSTDDDDDDKPLTAAQVAGEGLPAGTNPVGTSGVEKVKALLASNVPSVTLLTKQWIALKSVVSDSALSLLAKSLSIDELGKISQFLSATERKDWKNILDRGFTQEQYAVADSFLTIQLSESILIPPTIVDEEARNMLASVTPQECAQCAIENPKVGGFLLNMLTTIQVARIMTLLPEKVLVEVVRATNQITAEDTVSLVFEAKKQITSIREKNKVTLTPFLEKSLDLMADVSLPAEDAIFRAMAQSGASSLLHKAATEYFPAELFAQLDSALLNQILNKFPAAVRAEIIWSRTPEIKETFMKAFGASSKLMEMMQMELEEIEIDEKRKALVQANSEELWKKFVTAGRTIIKSNKALALQLDPLITDWVEQNIRANAPGGSHVRAA